MKTYACKVQNAQSLIDLMVLQRDVFNFISEKHFGSDNNIVKLHSKVYNKTRKKFRIPSKYIVNSEKECLSNYRSAKSNKHKLEKPIEKKNLSIQLDRDIFTYQKDVFRVTTLEGRKTFELEIYPLIGKMFSKYKFSPPKLYVRQGEVYAGFTFDIPEILPQNELACGVDLGLRRIATTSEGKIFQDKPYLANKRKVRYKKRQLQSKGTKSAKRKLKTIRRTESRQTRDFVHRLSKAIIKSTKADHIIIEDLSKIKDKKKRGISKYQKINRLSQAPFFMIRQFLTYKAPLYGKVVKTVCPSFTSQIDHRTGRKDGERRGCRYICKDGIILDADVNASLVIAARSKHPVSSCKGLDGQAKVNRLNVLCTVSKSLV